MLHLKTLQIHAIGRFVDPQTIDFDRLGNLVQVDGLNKNTKGSSGAAKSTIFNSIDYLLGLNDIPVTVLQSRLTKDPILIKGIFDWDGRHLEITRGKSIGLAIKIDGESKGGSVKLSEEVIDGVLGMPRDLFRKILHKRQKEGGFFLNMPPRETNDFIMDCLKLDKEKSDLEQIEKKLSELKVNKEQVAGLLEVQKQGLKATQDAILSIGLAPIRDMHEEVVQSLKDKRDLSLLNVQIVEKRHNMELSAIQETKPKYISIPFQANSYTTTGFDRNLITRCEEGLKVINEKIIAINKIENDRISEVQKQIHNLKLRNLTLRNKTEEGQKAQKEAEAKAAHIRTLRANRCYICAQDWVNAENKETEAKLLGEILVLKQIIDEGASADIELMDFDLNLMQLQEQLKPVQTPELIDTIDKKRRVDEIIAVEKEKEKTHNKSEGDKLRAHQENEKARLKDHQTTEQVQNSSLIADYDIKEKELRSRHTAEYQQAFGQYDVDNRTFESANSKLKLYNDSKKRYDDSVTRLKVQESEYTKAVDFLSIRLSTIERDLIMSDESRRALKSYISAKFDEALEGISETASQMLAHVPNMATATIQMRGTKENKDGKVKEEVNAVINMDGEEAIPIRSLSGGERSATDLAIDLAVIDFLEHRTGKGINIFVLDEPFEGLDTVCVEQTLEILKNANFNKKLIIVDHNPEVKQMVGSRIMVIREGLTSNIVQE